MHNFIIRETTPPDMRLCKALGAYILGHAIGRTVSVSRTWKQDRSFKVSIGSGEKRRDTNLRFRTLVRHLRSHRSYDNEGLGMPAAGSFLDGMSMHATMTGPMVGPDGGWTALGLPFYGGKTVVKPQIDREGMVYGSFQPAVLLNIHRQWSLVVERSNVALSSDNGLWLNALRTLLSDTVAIVDMTLHQLYYEAEFRLDQHTEWTFDPARLQKRHGMRLMDKFRWIHRITGKTLNNADQELRALKRIKAVRNHFNHFDPPVVAWTIEDVIGWLKDVQRVGVLLWRIRQALQVGVPTGVVQLVLLPKVRLNPLDPRIDRQKQSENVKRKGPA